MLLSTLSLFACKKDNSIVPMAKANSEAPLAVERHGFKLAVIDTGAVSFSETDILRARVRCNGSIIDDMPSNQYLAVEKITKPDCKEYGYDILGTSHINIVGLNLQIGSINKIEIYNAVTGTIYASYTLSASFASPFNSTSVTAPSNGTHCGSGWNMGLDTMVLITFK